MPLSLTGDVVVRLIWEDNQIEFSFEDEKSIGWAREHADELDAVIQSLWRKHGGTAVLVGERNSSIRTPCVADLLRVCSTELRSAFPQTSFYIVGSWEETKVQRRHEWHGEVL